MKLTTDAVLVVALLVVSTLLLVPGQALADVPTKASSTWQTNGIVYAVAYARGNVYIGGAFTSVRPPGAAPGTGEVARNHLAAFNATTGALLSFNHNANATVYSLEPSPDKTRLYAGGDFTAVDGAARGHLAAFDLASGALSGAWKPSVTGRVKSISTFGSGGTLYVGGTFGNGHIDPGWFPNTSGNNLGPRSLGSDGVKLGVGGDFHYVNNKPQQGFTQFG